MFKLDEPRFSGAHDATVLASETKPRLVVDVDCAIAGEPTAISDPFYDAVPARGF
jgi:hypothetical protein